MWSSNGQSTISDLGPDDGSLNSLFAKVGGSFMAEKRTTGVKMNDEESTAKSRNKGRWGSEETGCAIFIFRVGIFGCNVPTSLKERAQRPAADNHRLTKKDRFSAKRV